MPPPAAWYRDPWGQAPLRWWDGNAWSAFTSPGPVAGDNPAEPRVALNTSGTSYKPGASSALGSDAGPTIRVESSVRSRLKWEIVIVLAIFPLPYVVNALAVSIQSAAHEGTPAFPIPIPSHLGLSFLIDLRAEPRAPGCRCPGHLPAVDLRGRGQCDRPRSDRSQARSRPGAPGVPPVFLDPRGRSLPRCLAGVASRRSRRPARACRIITRSLRS